MTTHTLMTPRCAKCSKPIYAHKFAQAGYARYYPFCSANCRDLARLERVPLRQLGPRL